MYPSEVTSHQTEPETASGSFIWASALLQERLVLLREMLESMVDATPAGQRYIMSKVVRVLRDEALRPDARFTVGDRAIVNRSLEDLEHELARIAPDVEGFDSPARILIEILSLA